MADSASSQPHHAFYRIFSLLFAALLLVAMSGLALGSVVHKSPVPPEAGQIVRGWGFLQTGRMLRGPQPPLTAILNGAALLLEPDLPSPADLDGWTAGNTEEAGQSLLWGNTSHPLRLLFLARLPTIWLTLLLGSLVWRWAADMYGRWGAGLALLMVAFSPNILAHGRFATSDIGLAVLFIATLVAWQRFSRTRRLRWLLLVGVLLAGALSSGYPALLLPPILLLLTPWAVRRSQPFIIRLGVNPLPLLDRVAQWRHGGLLIAVIVLAAVFVLAAGITLIAGLWTSAYWQGLTAFISRPHRIFLFERFVPVENRFGWWYGALTVLGSKLPLPVLILVLFSAVLSASRRVSFREHELLLPLGVYLLAGSLVPAGLEMRTLLPAVVLMMLFAARVAAGPLRSGMLRPLLLSPFVLALLAANLLAYPHYLPFFNVAVGGAQNGRRILAESNIDWGQDLPALADYLTSRGNPVIFLSAVGSAPPAVYGIDYYPLPGEANLEPVAFLPMNPSPGLYAISVAHLTGVDPLLDDTFAYFRNRTPTARIGGSIYLYQLDPLPEQDGPPWFAQCAITAPFERESVLQNLTGESDLRVFNFDCQQSLPLQEGLGWLLLPPGIAPVVDMGPPDYVDRFADGSPRYRVWRVVQPPAIPSPSIQFPSVPLPLPIAGSVELLGYDLSATTLSPDDSLRLTTWWRVRDVPEPPLSVFAEILTDDGQVVAAAEGLGVVVDVWQPGVMFAQQHTIALDQVALSGGSYSVAVGLFVPTTGQRLPVSQAGGRVVNRVVLRAVQISDGLP